MFVPLEFVVAALLIAVGTRRLWAAALELEEAQRPPVTVVEAKSGDLIASSGADMSAQAVAQKVGILRRWELGKRKILKLLWWVAFALAVLIGWKAYDEYRFVQAHRRAMELLGKP
jgi:hypothetical protein